MECSIIVSEMQVPEEAEGVTAERLYEALPKESKSETFVIDSQIDSC